MDAISSDQVRDVRDILGECMRREVLGLTRPLWPDWWEEGREPYRKRADHLMRLLAQQGVQVALNGPAQPRPEAPEARIIESTPLAEDPRTERAIRIDDKGFSILLTNRNGTTVEQSFTLEEASICAGMVLAGSPNAARPGLGRMLAATVEIYRLDADVGN